MIEEKLEADLLHQRGECAAEHLPVAGEGGVERLRVALAIGGFHFGVCRDRGIDFAVLHRFKQTLPDVFPLLPVGARHGADVGDVRDEIVALEEIAEQRERLFVERLAGLARLRGGDARLDHAFVSVEFLRKRHRSHAVNAALEPVVEQHMVAQFHDFLLKRVPKLLVHALDLLRLFLDRLQMRLELGERKVFVVLLLPAEQAEHVGIVDEKSFVLVGPAGFQQHIHEPFARLQRATGGVAN